MRQPRELAKRMGRSSISITYETSPRDRPLSAVSVQAAAGDPRRGWLTADGWTVPVALGRGGIKANKREGDGGTPRGTFYPLQLWWRADRHVRPKTFLPIRPIRPQDAWCEDPADRHYNQPVQLGRDQGGDRLTRDDHLYDFIVEIDHNAAPRIAGRGRLRFDDAFGDVAFVAADGAANQDCYWMKHISGTQHYAREKSDRIRFADPA